MYSTYICRVHANVINQKMCKFKNFEFHFQCSRKTEKDLIEFEFLFPMVRVNEKRNWKFEFRFP